MKPNKDRSASDIVANCRWADLDKWIIDQLCAFIDSEAEKDPAMLSRLSLQIAEAEDEEDEEWDAAST